MTSILTEKQYRDLLSEHVFDDRVEKILREDRKALQREIQLERCRDREFYKMEVER